MNKISQEIKLIEEFIEVHKKNSENYFISFVSENLGYDLYQLLPFNYDEKSQEVFKEAKKKLLNYLGSCIEKENLIKEHSFIYYYRQDDKERKIWNLTLAKYLDLLKKSASIVKYGTYLREASGELKEKAIKFDTFFSLAKLKDFCYKYMLLDASYEGLSKNRPRGTQDIYPPRSRFYQKIQQIITEILDKNNYQPIIFPSFEYGELFTRSLGSTTDVVNKEIYTFLDRRGRELALRPEGTASTVRLVYQNKLIREGYQLKLYYWANMFRYERPQKGRYREFWQLGVELINAQGVVADYQTLKLVSDILGGLGIKNFIFKLNYLGNSKTKEKYKCDLRKFVEKEQPDLCEDCRRRYKTNPLRILDCLLCKSKFSFPSYKNAWDEQDNDYINELNKILNKFSLPYRYDFCLVRGLDYYTGLVFEVDLGTEKAILGGGRYDKLYQEIGSIDVPALGFAIGVERLVDYSEEKKLVKIDNEVDVFFFTCSSTAYLDIFFWKEKLEKYPLVVDYNLEVRKIKNLPKIIDYYQPKMLIVLGENELKSKNILIKDCQKRQDFLVEKEKVVEWILIYLKLINK